MMGIDIRSANPHPACEHDKKGKQPLTPAPCMLWLREGITRRIAVPCKYSRLQLKLKFGSISIEKERSLGYSFYLNGLKNAITLETPSGIAERSGFPFNALLLRCLVSKPC